jgi:cytochrome c biogenesis protein CcmG, thiol:disulfide interchange protein DsbE
MKSFVKQFISTILFLIFLSGVSITVVAQDITPNKKMYAKSFYHQKAPEFVVEKWLSEEPDMKGKFIMIDFWATWCGPCKKAIPKINDWAEKYKDQMVVIGLSDESEAKVRSMKTPVMEYYSAIDTQKRLKNIFQVTGIPHIVVIDPNGIVRWQGFPFLGGHELTEEVMEELFVKYGN